MILGFQEVRLAAVDLAGATSVAVALFGAPVDRSSDAALSRWRLTNLELVLVPAVSAEAAGLVGLVLRTDSLSDAGRLLERRGVEVAMCERDGAAALRLDTDVWGGLPMFLAENGAEENQAPGGDGALHSLDHLVVRTANPDRAAAFFGARLGLDLRLDRANPTWRSRLLFFRCGDAVVEIAADPAAPIADAPDQFGGLAWRATDPDAARNRLATAGLDVSEVRDGRKPGSRVFTLRRGLPGGPSLVISANTRIERAA